MPNQITTAIASGAVDAGTAYPLTGAIMQVYSKEIMFHAQPVLKFKQFAQEKLDLTVLPGRSINMLRYNNLGRGGSLTEGIRLQTEALSSQQIPITVYEQGKAISVSELLLQSSFDDVMASGAKSLGINMAKTLDAQMRDVVLATTNVVYAPDQNTSPSTDVTSRANIVSTCYFGTEVVKDAVEILATNNAPKIADEFYICSVHPHQARVMRDDTRWYDVSKYSAAIQIFNGEIGKFEGVRFIETTMMTYIKKTAATPPVTAGQVWDNDGYTGTTVVNPALVDVYQAVMFGDNAFGHAVSLPVEMRDNGVIDFGREHSLAWYSIWGNGIITEPNIVRIESA